MKKNILNLEGVKIISKKAQKDLTGGFGHFQVCPQFLPCWSNSDCPCGPCGVTINGFRIDDLCAF